MVFAVVDARFDLGCGFVVVLGVVISVWTSFRCCWVCFSGLFCLWWF